MGVYTKRSEGISYPRLENKIKNHGITFGVTLDDILYGKGIFGKKLRFNLGLGYMHSLVGIKSYNSDSSIGQDSYRVFYIKPKLKLIPRVDNWIKLGITDAHNQNTIDCFSIGADIKIKNKWIVGFQLSSLNERKDVSIQNGGFYLGYVLN